MVHFKNLMILVLLSNYHFFPANDGLLCIQEEAELSELDRAESLGHETDAHSDSQVSVILTVELHLS